MRKKTKSILENEVFLKLRKHPNAAFESHLSDLLFNSGKSYDGGFSFALELVFDNAPVPKVIGINKNGTFIFEDLPPFKGKLSDVNSKDSRFNLFEEKKGKKELFDSVPLDKVQRHFLTAQKKWIK